MNNRFISIIFFIGIFLNGNIFSHAYWKQVDFDRSMGKGSEFYNEFYRDFFKEKGNEFHPIINMTNEHVMNLFRDLYKNNSLLYRTKIKKGRIPKIIHQIWIGGSLPQRYKNLQQTWIKNHPDWKYKFWTDKEVAQFIKTIDPTTKEIFESAESYAEKADILRYEILYRFGGLYVDADFESLKSMDIIHDNYDFYTGLSQIDEDLLYVAIGIIGAVPHHPVLQFCIENLKKSRHSQEITERTGPLFFTKAILHVLTNTIDFKLYDNILILPATYFYPVGAKARKLVLKPLVLKRYLKLFPEAFACHYWHGTWLENPLYNDEINSSS